ncbi:MAG: hypothetical protein Q8P15_04100 [Nanoarchaeota archaeon]|nr:hypothetical protein [Nanoarchaeota archaeon]
MNEEELIWNLIEQRQDLWDKKRQEGVASYSYNYLHCNGEFLGGNITFVQKVFYTKMKKTITFREFLRMIK